MSVDERNEHDFGDLFGSDDEQSDLAPESEVSEDEQQQQDTQVASSGFDASPDQTQPQSERGASEQDEEEEQEGQEDEDLQYGHDGAIGYDDEEPAPVRRPVAPVGLELPLLQTPTADDNKVYSNPFSFVKLTSCISSRWLVFLTISITIQLITIPTHLT